MSKERPILFSGPMVRAILEGRKTQTRRIIKCATGSFWDHRAWRPLVVNGAIAGWVCMNGMNDGHFFGAGSPMPKCPYGKPGDRLWVRETWCPDFEPYTFRYRADGSEMVGRWHPSIHMPRWASRITLEVVSVRVERLKVISGDGAYAEGINQQGIGSDAAMVKSFSDLWESINGPGSWEANPWVWVVEFKRVKP
jgi:hypothetical protein